MLTQFYKEMQAWVDAGCPDHAIFRRNLGLCGNLSNWDFTHRTEPELYEVQRDKFLSVSLSEDYPFNLNIVEWELEQADNALYTNPKRLDWIKRHANPVL